MNSPAIRPSDLASAHKLIMDQNCQLHEQGKNIDAQKKCIIDLKAQNAYLQEQLRLANLRRFARSSERFVDHNDPQGLLFDEDELPIPEEKDVEIQDIPAHQRKKRRGKRESLPEFLERIRVEHTLPESELIGPDGEQYTKIGEVTSEELQVIPMQMRVIVHARYQYAVKEREELGVKIAPMPKKAIPKSIASSSLLAHIVQAKFCHHLPLYRQEQIWQALDVSIPRNSMCRWIQKLGDLTEPLIAVMLKKMKQHGHIHVDETTVTLLKDKNKKEGNPSHLGYMWVYKNRHGTVFDYRACRSGKNPESILGDYKGYIQTDRYGGYNILFKEGSGRVSAGCMAHARRKFMEIAKLSKNKSTGISHYVISRMKVLYDIERLAKDKAMPSDELLKLRQSQAIPILDDLKKYLIDKEPTIPPRSGLHTAVCYFLRHFDALKRYTESPLVNIDNNPAERAIKPFAVGRKNWLFCGNEKGAIASANLYSLIESAKTYNLKIFDYLQYLFERLPNLKDENDLLNLLPVNAQHYLPKVKRID